MPDRLFRLTCTVVATAILAASFPGEVEAQDDLICYMQTASGRTIDLRSLCKQAKPMEQQPSPWWQRQISDQQLQQLHMIGDWTTQQQALVYTPEQQARVEAGIPKGQSLEQFWTSINVTPEQQAKLLAIHRESQRRMKAVVISDDP